MLLQPPCPGVEVYSKGLRKRLMSLIHVSLAPSYLPFQDTCRPQTQTWDRLLRSIPHLTMQLCIYRGITRTEHAEDTHVYQHVRLYENYLSTEAPLSRVPCAA